MSVQSALPGSLILEPIGFVRSTALKKVDAPRQPAVSGDTPGRIELLPGRHLEHALEDLQGWDYLWVIFWFHLNTGWRPKVLPPRGPRKRRGVLATRSPHRPNPLGLSAVRLERVDGLTLHVRGVDMVDGTPVLDIKPYVPYTDAHPGAASGWLELAGAGRRDTSPPDPVAAYTVEFTARAAAQAAWIEARTGLALQERIGSLLGADPSPRPYRRIRRERDGLRLAVQDWRVRFTVSGRRVTVEGLASGYRSSQLAAPAPDEQDPLAPHREFIARWPTTADPE
jgi:tRNA-Thr(GGU) m(6)t(6)A37 methyltransferase TsaA